MKKTTYISFFIAILLSMFTSCSTGTMDKLQKIANETNKTLPKVIDEYTFMESCQLRPDTTLVYSYEVKSTLIFSPKELSLYEQQIKNQLIDNIKQDPAYDFFKSNNVKFEHVYLNSNGINLANIKLNPDDY